MAENNVITNRLLKSDLIKWRELEWFQGELKHITTDDMNRLKQAIIKNSFIQPFNVWQDKNKKIWILDGHQRKQALDELESEGYKIPDMLPANFIKCKNRTEAAEAVLLYSSIYAKVQDEHLFNFINDNKIDYKELKFQIDLPSFDTKKFEIMYMKDVHFQAAERITQPQMDEKSKVKCPNCGTEFEPK